MIRRKTLKSLIFLAASLAPASGLAADASEASASAVTLWEEAPGTLFDAEDVDLDAFKWIARPVIVFADAPLDPSYREQIELLNARIDELTQRDVVIIVDTAPDPQSDIRRKLRPRGFMLTVVSKEGRVILRKPFPWNVREISRSIDKLPIRKQEIRDASSGVE